MNDLVLPDLSLAGLIVGAGPFRAGPFDLTVRSGETIVVVGPNGSGKTTLMKTIAGLKPPVAGAVKRPGPVAYLPPPGAVQAEFEALHVVALGRAGRSVWSIGLSTADRIEAREAMAALGLGDLARRRFDTLSSGQQQLVLIARTMVQDAPVCLFDEPTALLDPSHRGRIVEALKRLADQGRTVLVSTHDLDLAGRADRVVLMSDPPNVHDGALEAQTITDLFGAAVVRCPCCGQMSPV